MLHILIVFFFFQAEDGIRDLTVTGVQTCALPIWDWLEARMAERGLRTARELAAALGVANTAVLDWLKGADTPSLRSCEKLATYRSEERRVGEKCRSRWSPHHLKKKKISKQ